MPDPVQEACDDLVATLEIPDVVMTGSVADGVVRVEARGPEAARDRFLEMAMDLFFYMPDEIGPGARYEFTLRTPSHELRLATAVDLMLDTGEVTPEAWEAFRAQLEFTEDGRAVEYPVPDLGP